MPPTPRISEEQTLISLAILNVNWERGKHHYVDNFVPFTVECASRAEHREVLLDQVYACVKAEFGLNIPKPVLRTVLSRAMRHGYFVRADGLLVRNDEAIAQSTFAADRAQLLRAHAQLISLLRNFARTEYGLSWSEDEADTHLLAFLDHGSVPILAAAIEGAPYEAPERSGRSPTYVVARFILQLSENDPAGFEYLGAVAKGNALATTLYFPDFGEVERGFENLELYFDTPFLLRAIGLNGEAVAEPFVELLDMAHATGARLRCFDDTHDEILGVLDASSKALRRGTSGASAYGPVFDFFVQSNYRAVDVEGIIARLDTILRSFRVELRERPDPDTRLTVDESALETALADNIRYSRRDALLHDLNALTSINRLRRGRRAMKLESSRALFVTTNSGLARVARDFFRHQDGAVPLCVSDQLFTRIVG